MIKPLLVNQFFGLGDIIYIQALLTELSKSRKIIFPIADEYFWVTKYLIPNNNIEYVLKSSIENIVNLNNPFPSENYLPLRWATQIYHELAPTDYSHDYTVMEDKYRLLNMDPKKWISYDFVRNFHNENELYIDKVSNKDYALINKHFGSSIVGVGVSNFNVDYNNIVTLEKYKNYTLMDWIKVIEEAKEIHTVSTSIVYLVDKYARKDCNINVYSRNMDPKSLDGIKNILTRGDWNFIYE